MPTYRNADQEVGPLVKELMEEYYADIFEEGVTVECLFAFGGLKFHGYPAAAVVKVNSQEQRVAGRADVVIRIDGDGWKDLPDIQKRSVIHHELEHLVICKNEEGVVKTDDCHRPKIRLKLHDWQLGGFACIAERYGEDALEVQCARLTADRYGQFLFPWMADDPCDGETIRAPSGKAGFKEQVASFLKDNNVEVETNVGADPEDGEPARKRRQRTMATAAQTT